MNQFKKHSWWFILGILTLGLIFRFWQITQNQFLFYDEGMYLGYNRKFLNLVAANAPKNINEFIIILGLMFKMALTTAKSFWFFLLNLRVFIVGPEAWYFARIISALASIATLALTYAFAYRYFQSKKIALISIVFLSLLPSHVFYSRLGMQESLSTLLFLAAIYLYVFYKPLNYKTIISAMLLVLLFLTNYRMIIAPIFLVAIEIFEALKDRKQINWIKLLVCITIFGGLIFIVGSLYDGVNRYVTFGWLFHQAQEAQGKIDFLSFFSFPYYVFALEGFLFAMLFWGNIYLVLRKQWSKILPFILVLIQMGIFSLAAEKGARYLCVVLPFMTIAAAVLAEVCLNLNKYRRYALVWICLTCIWMGFESFKIVTAQTDYSKAIELILKHNPKAKILSTQPLTEQLYISEENSIQECPKGLAGFTDLSKNEYHNGFLDYYKQGFQYLVVDPQMYVSWTKDKQRFSPPLIDFMESIQSHVPALVVFEHLNKTLLNRFVLDHNQNLFRSIKFLNEAKQKGYGQIKIYNLEQCVLFLRQQAIQNSQ